MAWNYRSGQILINKMFDLYERGYSPRCFLDLNDSSIICSSCDFGKCKRKPWHTKGSPGSLRSDADNFPEAKVSIIQIISAQPGLVLHMDDRHTKDRMIGACVFLDNYTRYSYTHLQTSIDGDQTLETKQGFEQHSASFGVKIKSYHADNGIFVERSFRDEIKISEQQITFCRVGAHHQNSIVEKPIEILTLGN